MRMVFEMLKHERAIYPNSFQFWINILLFPLKMIIPQPLIAKFPLLTTNLTIRTQLVLQEVKGRLLDIGCGNNGLVKAYRQRGEEGIGIDTYAWEGVDEIIENSSQLPYASESVDSVTFVACINHIPYREEALIEARRILRPNGRLIVTNLTPLLSRVWHAMAFWDSDQHERGMETGEVFGFTTKDLVSLLRKTGFVVEKRVLFSWFCNQLYVCKIQQQ